MWAGIRSVSRPTWRPPRCLKLDGAKHFALRSLDRVLAEAWQPEQGLQHVVAYSDPAAERRLVPGLLDDYAFTAIACLDAYEATADLSYFHFAQRIVDKMVERFFDPVSGGFFDTAAGGPEKALGVLGTRRKPFQDSPTPAGNSVAAIALLRLHAFTNQQELSRKSGTDVGVAGRTCRQVRDLCRDLRHCSGLSLMSPHPDRGHRRRRPGRSSCTPPQPASSHFTRRCSSWRPARSFRKICHRRWRKRIPQLPVLKEGKSVAVVCSGFSCQPPITDPEQLQTEASTLALKSLNRNYLFRGQKNRADHAIRNRSARSGPKPLARLINSLFQSHLPSASSTWDWLGLHSGIGPSSALSIGVAIATYVQAKPTIRINILTARFMVFSLRCEAPGRKPHGGGIIQKSDRASSLFSSDAFAALGESAHLSDGNHAAGCRACAANSR